MTSNIATTYNANWTWENIVIHKSHIPAWMRTAHEQYLPTEGPHYPLDFSMFDVQDIATHGCESGVWMPAVTYHVAKTVMHIHGDEIFDYLSDHECLNTALLAESFSGLCVIALSVAVELWAQNIMSHCEGIDLGDHCRDDMASLISDGIVTFGDRAPMWPDPKVLPVGTVVKFRVQHPIGLATTTGYVEEGSVGVVVGRTADTLLIEPGEATAYYDLQNLNIMGSAMYDEGYKRMNADVVGNEPWPQDEGLVVYCSGVFQDTDGQCHDWERELVIVAPNANNAPIGATKANDKE